VDHWDVSYDYRGITHRTQMTSPPGATVTVNADREPREYAAGTTPPVYGNAQTRPAAVPRVAPGNRPQPPDRTHSMTTRTRHTLTAAFAAIMLITVSGCAVTRGQESVGAYIDDSAITAAVKSQLFDNKIVDGSAVSVETLNGTVMLSGFAKNTAERSTAESVTWKVKGVRAVKNELAVRP